jgi:transposase
MMMEIPTQLTELQFQQHIAPHLSTAQRGYVRAQPLHKIFNSILYKLHTGCQWDALPIEKDAPDQPIMSSQGPYYHFRKWSRDGSVQRLADAGILAINYEWNLSELHLDGSHTIAKKGAKVSPIKDGRKQKRAPSFH